MEQDLEAIVNASDGGGSSCGADQDLDGLPDLMPLELEFENGVQVD
jgi:hypothetical protein